MRILVVEPDRELGTIIKKFLETKGHNVDHTLTAQSAIYAADTNQPDLVVLELAMAEHNGVAFLHEFRSYNDWLDIPVIVYSQIPLENSGLKKSDWQARGVQEYLYKPTSRLESLLSYVTDYQYNEAA